MRWMREPYLGESILTWQREHTGPGKTAGEELLLLAGVALPADCLFLCLAQREPDWMDIYPAFVLRQDYYQKQELARLDGGRLLLGVAGDRREAQELVCRILEEYFATEPARSFREYIFARGKR